MSKEQWLEKLKYEQRNRDGLGMYVLDTFNEEIAELLAKHDKELEEETINKCKRVIKRVSGSGYVDIDGDWVSPSCDTERALDKLEELKDRSSECEG